MTDIIVTVPDDEAEGALRRLKRYGHLDAQPLVLDRITDLDPDVLVRVSPEAAQILDGAAEEGDEPGEHFIALIDLARWVVADYEEWQDRIE